MNNATRLKRITSEAKRIRKTKPNMKWVDAVRAASKKLSKSRPDPVKKKAAKKVGAVRTVSKKHTDQNRITANIQFGGKKITKRTAAVNTSIENLRRYADIVRQINDAEDYVKKYKQTYQNFKKFDKREAGIALSLVLQYQKQLINLRKQKAIAKKLI